MQSVTPSVTTRAQSKRLRVSASASSGGEHGDSGGGEHEDSEVSAQAELPAHAARTHCRRPHAPRRERRSSGNSPASRVEHSAAEPLSALIVAEYQALARLHGEHTRRHHHSHTPLIVELLKILADEDMLTALAERAPTPVDANEPMTSQVGGRAVRGASGSSTTSAGCGRTRVVTRSCMQAASVAPSQPAPSQLDALRVAALAAEERASQAQEAAAAVAALKLRVEADQRRAEAALESALAEKERLQRLLAKEVSVSCWDEVTCCDKMR